MQYLGQWHAQFQATTLNVVHCNKYRRLECFDVISYSVKVIHYIMIPLLVKHYSKYYPTGWRTTDILTFDDVIVDAHTELSRKVNSGISRKSYQRKESTVTIHTKIPSKAYLNFRSLETLFVPAAYRCTYDHQRYSISPAIFKSLTIPRNTKISKKPVWRRWTKSEKEFPRRAQ